MAACRRWDLALGHSWAEAGWLERSQDIFWLTVPEIEQAIMQETNAAVTLSSTIKARQDTYRSYANTKMPSHLKDSQLPSIQVGVGLSPDRPSDVILGLPISPGQSRGRVVVMRQPQELEPNFSDDIILVMPSTDPAWLAQLPFASGLIVEKGGLLSHGSIIAREYGLPAVANIPHATQRFRTGETVLVDGTTGIVQRLESHSVNSPSR
jgi:pyruvate,water dikinase